jgi:hydrogenase nickel incorporation protein HypA/HybF
MIDIAINHARSANAKKINLIEVELGELSGVIDSALEFCFEAVCKDTIAEGAKLSLHKVSAMGECQDCNTQFNIDSLIAQCSNCNSMKVNLIQGKELRIKSIIVD